MEKPPTLEYQTPPQGPNRRQRASSYALWNGAMNLLWVMASLAGFIHFLKSPKNFNVPSSYYSAQSLTWQIATIVSGVCFLVGGVIIRRPNRPWEIVVLVCGVMQGLVLLILTGWFAVTIITDPDNRIWQLDMLMCVLQILYLLALPRKIYRIRRDEVFAVKP